MDTAAEATHTTPQSLSVVDSLSITSEATFSTISIIDPITPTTSFDSEPEQDDQGAENPSDLKDSGPTQAIMQTWVHPQEQSQKEEAGENNLNTSAEVTTISNALTGTTPPIDNAENDYIPSLSLWDDASEHVATVALQCLSRDKDMELSYVAILSAMTVLQSKHDQPLDDLYEQNRHIQEARNKVAKDYSQIMKIMCRSGIAESLSKEVLRQGVMSSDALFSQFYGSIQQAGYELEDYAHLSMAKYWLERNTIEEAQDCLSRIDSSRWNGPVYREAITCLLFSKPRHMQEAESMLQKYIEYKEASQDTSEEPKIRTWFRLQLDASKWEEVKAQYERRRTRLIDGPSNSERANHLGPTLTPEALHQLQEQHASPQRQFKHERSRSITSSITSSSNRRSPIGHQRISSSNQRTPSVAPSWPSGASANLSPNTTTTIHAPAPAPTKGALSFLSSLKFAKSTDVENSMNTSSALPSRLNVTHHLTVLDNGMLEECINYREFEYGWKHIYEKMGSTLEDGETTKIAMRLCRQAFLGHNGLDPNHLGSPNLVNGDVFFDDSLNADEVEPDIKSSTRAKQDPAIWEARAWAIYNKVKMNPHSLPSNKPVPAAHTHLSGTSVNGANAHLGKLSDHSGNGGATPMALFLHDILTIATHSPEMSSCYLKAFKVYTFIRSETNCQNLLRDPFVMTCMIKAIYDAAQAVVNNPEQKLPERSEKNEEVKKHHRRSSSLSLNRSQPMTLGPLMDLAFEIYSDMRNVGPIRHLPSLITLTPSSPTGSKAHRLSGGIPISTLPENGVSTTVSPRASFAAPTGAMFQELNPTLTPHPQARRLPTEVYLALLHLCILTPEPKISSQVVKTIMSDMTSSSGQRLHRLDCHLAAALQCYHDSWMVCSFDADNKTKQQGKCIFSDWMYQSEEFVRQHIATVEQIPSNGVMSFKSESSTGERSRSPEGLHLSIDRSEQKVIETCNDGFYWDLWTDNDTTLKDIQFTKTKADMLWEHVAQALL
ncbi:hypothetical protein BGX21_008019 [Mortierella sp. AD011]|nr:hypothetical protein BGX20_010053 [Mortierella sp. AD010]KAF9398248.1 hypothetical protein BGX21_008019 [Mortierella sp. AD011]